jgi:hypothetical protein
MPVLNRAQHFLTNPKRRFRHDEESGQFAVEQRFRDNSSIAIEKARVHAARDSLPRHDKTAWRAITLPRRWSGSGCRRGRVLRCRGFAPNLFRSLAHLRAFFTLAVWHYDHLLSDGLFIWGREGIRTCSSHDAGASFASATASGATRSSCASDLSVRVAVNERAGTNADKNDLRKFR